MCIIAVKKAGVAAPTKELFENMWAGNPDGAGFMWAADNAVHIEKGFMTYEDFEKAYDRVAAKIDVTETPMVFHFRITTHGGTTPENTHPFPITDNLGVLRKLASKSSVAVAHNGILSIQPRQGISDTMEYVLTKLNLMRRINRKFPHDKHFQELIRADIGQSRLAFLCADGKIDLIGNFITDADTGLIFSNDSYKTSRYSCGWGYGYGATDWKKVCDVYELGGKVELDGNVLDEYGTFYVDKKGNVYGYDWDDDVILPCSRAKMYNDVKWNDKFVEYMPLSLEGSFEDIIDFETEYERCYWCGALKHKDELRVTEFGKLCDDCIEELEGRVLV